MSLKKETVIDRIEILSNGVVQVKKRVIVKDGEQHVAASIHRVAIAPGDDCSTEAERVRAVCAVAHTPDVVKSYRSQNTRGV
jgi:hypothetical protein